MKKEYRDYTIVILTALLSRFLVAFLSTNRLDIAEYYRWAMGLQYGLTTAFYRMPNLDYPPLQLPILFFNGWLINNVTLAGNHPFFIIKLFPILMDVVASVLVFNIVKNRTNDRNGLIAALAYALNPALLINTAWWGQTDGLIMFFAIVICWLTEKKRLKSAAAACALAALTKIQGLFILPILGLELLRNKNPKTIALSAVIFLAVFFTGLSPFFAHSGVWGIVERIYFAAAEMRPIASLRAFNLLAFLGGSNVPDSGTPFGGPFTFFIIGVTLTALVAAGFIVYYLTRKRPNIWLGLAMIFYSIFMLMPRMHERYMIYVIPLFLIPAFTTPVKKMALALKALLASASVVIFVNHAILMWGVANQPTRHLWIDAFEQFVQIGAGVSVALYVAVCFVYLKYSDSSFHYL
ncbi:MAG: glycosyltransferase family 39 protein [Defluviitaleaceae bacterium]|nr:glycosyltransferase family 39 protein [Defluviitaleaceae bacterium]